MPKNWQFVIKCQMSVVDSKLGGEEREKNVIVEEGLELNSKDDQNMERQRGRENDVRCSRNVGIGFGLFVDDQQQNLNRK